MNVLVKKNSSVFSDGNSPGYRRHLRAWLFSWEIYVIVVLSAFLRLYRIDTTEFDADQADIFRMAHDAIIHGHLVATSNVASIGINNPPGTIYLLMVPALFSANPLSGAIFTAILGILAVVLTYIFTRHFYGRIAGTLVAFFYGTAVIPVFYSRFMWNQNLLLLFVPLFMAALFWGVVKRRQGWLGPAIFLLGFLIQLHGSAVLLSVPLIGALFLAPKTFGRRDFLWGSIAILVIYAPYMLWFFASNFADIYHLLHTPITNPTVFDNQSLLLYQRFVSPFGPFDVPFTNTRSVLYSRLIFLKGLGWTMTVLVIAGLLSALAQVCWSPGRNKVGLRLWQRLPGWWSTLRASPYRCGLILLLLWQLVPVVYMLRHTLDVYAHYFIILLPGEFIVIGLFIAQVVNWLRQLRISFVPQVRFVFYVLAILIVAIQFVASTGSIIDITRGDAAIFSVAHPYYSNLSSLQGAVNEADQLAQQHHYNRLYISADFATRTALRYLGSQTHTPSTVFDDNCAVLPGATSGPAVLLMGPESEQANALVTHFSQARLVDTPQLLGSSNPFRLYIVNTPAQPVAHATLSNELQFVNSQTFNDNNTPSIVARWTLMRSEQPNDKTIYSYSMRVVNPDGPGKICTFTAMRAGDQVLSPFQPPATGQQQLNLQVQSYSVVPYTITLGFINFDTYQLTTLPWKMLNTADGKNILPVPAT